MRARELATTGTPALFVTVVGTPAPAHWRETLADTAGMLFPYNPPRELTMWMKNTYIPLDMVFIRADGIVHRIEERTEPFSETVIASRGDMAAVLELAGGAAQRLGLKAGDRVDYPLFKSK